MSHIRIWRKVANGNEDYCLVLEDDAIFPANFPLRLGQIWQRIKDNKDWQIFFLGFHDINPHIYRDKIISREIYQFTTFPRIHGGGTHSYLLRKSGAKALCDIVDRIGVQQPIDHFMIDQFDVIPTYYVYPPLILAEVATPMTPNVDSDIQKETEQIK